MFLQEEAFVGNTYIQAWLVVIRAFQNPMTVVCLDGYLRDRIVVDTESDVRLFGIFKVGLSFVGDIRVVILITTEDIELLIVGTECVYARENVVAGFYSYCHGVLSNVVFRVRRGATLASCQRVNVVASPK